MQVELSEEQDFTIFKVIGRLDTTTADQLEREIKDHLTEQVKNVILDMEELSYISSAGLRVVLILAKKMNERQGKFFLTALNADVYQVFEISGFLNILQVKPSIRDIVIPK